MSLGLCLMPGTDYVLMNEGSTSPVGCGSKGIRVAAVSATVLLPRQRCFHQTCLSGRKCLALSGPMPSMVLPPQHPGALIMLAPVL